MVSEQPLFGGQQNHYHSTVKVAVTSTTETGEQALLLTNYNRSHTKDYQGKCLIIIVGCECSDHAVADYLFERAEKPEDELSVWEA